MVVVDSEELWQVCVVKQSVNGGHLFFRQLAVARNRCFFCGGLAFTVGVPSDLTDEPGGALPPLDPPATAWSLSLSPPEHSLAPTTSPPKLSWTGSPDTRGCQSFAGQAYPSLLPLPCRNQQHFTTRYNL